PFLEDALLILISDADSRIRHRKRDRVIVPLRNRYSNLSSLGELQGIGDKITQDLRHFRFIAIDLNILFRVVENESYRRIGRQQWSQHAAQRGEHGIHAERGGPYRDLPGLYLCQVKQVVDQVQQILRRGAHESHLLFLLRRKIAIQTIEQYLAQSQY